MNRNEQRTQFTKLLDYFEARYIGSVYTALKGQYASFVKDLKAFGPNYAVQHLNMTIMHARMGREVKKIHTGAGVYMAQKTLSGLNKETRIALNSQNDANKHIPICLNTKYATFGHNDEWVNQIVEYFKKYLLDKVVIKVSETTRARLLEILAKATEEGWSNDQIIQALYESPEAKIEIRNRARMIVRTETVRAVNYGALLGADKYEYEVEKEWLSVHDNRTRRTHRHGTGVDGEKRDINGTFSNGLKFPGDPDGPASETIQCRCRVVVIAKRDERGRLIPKIGQRVYAQVA